jgi:putative transposase
VELAYWRKIWSTNPLERLNKEVKRRTNVGGIFPDDNALPRLAACALIEARDEWQVSDRRYLSEASMAQLTRPYRQLESRRDRHHTIGAGYPMTPSTFR